MITFKEKLDFILSNAISINGTIWYTNSETLRDAILRIYEESLDEILCCE